MAMLNKQKIAAIVIVLLGLVTAVELWLTRQPPAAVATAKQKKPTVVLKPLQTAQQVAQLATTREEKALAQEALRLADYDVDLAFDEAIRDVRLHPPPLSPEAIKAKTRLQAAEKGLEAAQDKARQLAELLVKVTGDKEASVEADLIQAEADIDLAQDEMEDAKHDLQAAGGDQAARLQAMKQEHETAAQNSQTAVSTKEEPAQQFGLTHRVREWWGLHQKQLQLWYAKGDTEAWQARLTTKHDALDAQIEAKKKELAAGASGSPSAIANPGAVASTVPGKSGSLTADRLKRTEEIANDQRIASAFDKRIEAKKELAAVYAQWIELVVAKQRAVLHRALQGIAVILAIGLVGLFFSSWLDSLVKRLSMDRRQLESLRTVVRVASQILALFLILLVLMGPPGQLGTFLGLAGAGLTVALKDFIVGFIGWFVLMGKNGMRLGDWVEINGVTGEVVQIGPIHTVLLETGNWTASGHPTGRRVTFTNSFAIEGHYFNFSTSGQWLWDEMQVVLPAGQDPYPTIDAIRKKVEELTSQSANEAEREWKVAAGSRELSSISVSPVVDVKPVVGGTQLVVRYVTRANERSTLRTKLNMAAVELLGVKAQPVER